ncbi:class I SAM-dependent methyltransferase [Neisseria yangbaofengii]|uniref:class I SAM-dependent methyltransferase n=1 Tax=Neisseria yangbaofengii TaxID=2709396 RepID=UPI0013EB02BD|nr:class I SAM-dependent methyltransferase [Neisseria yangbaofengii]
MKPHIPQPSDEARQSSQQLCQRIRQEIIAHDNWMPFSRFMELALYHPEFGYYTGGSHKIGSSGDFITAPTLSPLFAQTLARQLNTLLPQTDGNIYEFGAGTGRLAADLLPRLSDGLQNYYIIELSAELAQRQRTWLDRQLNPELNEKVIHLSALPNTFDGIILGNEVLDAIPVERMRYQAGAFRQVGVGVEDKQFIQTTKPLLSQTLMQAAQAYLPAIEGYTSELHPAQYAFISTLSQKLARGAMIWIDYGFDAQQYYHPQRNDGTLIGHYRHHTIHDPFFHIGLTDLTAHVNFTDIAQAATDAELDFIGYTTQAHFLLNLGITDLLAATGDVGSTAYLREAAAVQKLLNQHEMGELFKVIAFGKHINVDWQGFQFGDISHKL